MRAHQSEAAAQAVAKAKSDALDRMKAAAASANAGRSKFVPFPDHARCARVYSTPTRGVTAVVGGSRENLRSAAAVAVVAAASVAVVAAAIAVVAAIVYELATRRSAYHITTTTAKFDDENGLKSTIFTAVRWRSLMKSHMGWTWERPNRHPHVETKTWE